jgi:hypothetical protein
MKLKHWFEHNFQAKTLKKQYKKTWKWHNTVITAIHMEGSRNISTNRILGRLFNILAIKRRQTRSPGAQDTSRGYTRGYTGQ